MQQRKVGTVKIKHCYFMSYSEDTVKGLFQHGKKNFRSRENGIIIYPYKDKLNVFATYLSFITKLNKQVINFYLKIILKRIFNFLLLIIFLVYFHFNFLTKSTCFGFGQALGRLLVCRKFYLT